MGEGRSGRSLALHISVGEGISEDVDGVSNRPHDVLGGGGGRLGRRAGLFGEDGNVRVVPGVEDGRVLLYKVRPVCGGGEIAVPGMSEVSARVVTLK